MLFMYEYSCLGKPLEIQYLTFISVPRDRKELMHNIYQFHKANEFTLLVNNNCVSNVKICSRTLIICKSIDSVTEKQT